MHKHYMFVQQGRLGALLLGDRETEAPCLGVLKS